MGMLMVPGDPEVLNENGQPRRYVDKDYMLANFRTLYGGDTSGSDGHASRLLPPRPWVYATADLYDGLDERMVLALLAGQNALLMMGDKDKIVPEINGR